ncbi:unnamed protein product [Boreogadus saida]
MSRPKTTVVRYVDRVKTLCAEAHGKLVVKGNFSDLVKNGSRVHKGLGTTAVDDGSKGLRCSVQKDANRVALRGKLGRRTGALEIPQVPPSGPGLVVPPSQTGTYRGVGGGVLLSSDCPKGLMSIYYPAVLWAL